jgi:hypothetical protein
MTLSALGIFSAAGAGEVASDYELIQTYILGSSQPSITFSSLGTYSSTYKHLQVRAVARSANASTGTLTMWSRLNGDSATNYSWHALQGNGSTVASSVGTTTNVMMTGMLAQNNDTTGSFGATVIDLLDCYSTTKNKTTRSLSGYHAGTGTRIHLESGSWRNTASLTSWEMRPDTGSFLSGSRFSLYGIRG